MNFAIECTPAVESPRAISILDKEFRQKILDKKSKIDYPVESGLDA